MHTENFKTKYACVEICMNFIQNMNIKIAKSSDWNSLSADVSMHFRYSISSDYYEVVNFTIKCCVHPGNRKNVCSSLPPNMHTTPSANLWIVGGQWLCASCECVHGHLNFAPFDFFFIVCHNKVATHFDTHFKKAFNCKCLH